MQRGRDGKDDFVHPGNIFAGFGGFGSHRSMISNIFQGRDPFDDPFFTRPFGGNTMFDSGNFGPSGHLSDLERTNASKGVLIEEISSDDEGGDEGRMVDGTKAKTDEPRKFIGSCTEPSVEHPDDDAAKMNDVQNWGDHTRAETRQPKAQSFSFKKVTYGGVNGAYYTASTSTRAGSDGVVLEENKEANMSTGQAAHRISKGINDKGHSVTRKLGLDGKVDTMETLHNLEKEELAGFEEAWNGNAQKHLPGWKEGSRIDEDAGTGDRGTNGQFSRDGWALPSINHFESGTRPENEPRTNSSEGRGKRVVRINIE